MLLYLTGVISVLVALLAGAAIGYHVKEVYNRLHVIAVRLDEADKEAEPVAAVIAAKTPQEVRRYGEPDEESSIVRAKTPKDIQRERDLQLMNDLDKDSNG